jgi:hypothetical protein
MEGHRLPEHRPGLVTGGPGTFGDRFRRRYSRRPIEVCGYPHGLELKREVGPVRAYELGCASEQNGCGPVVLAVDRPVSGGGESGGGAVDEAWVGLPKLGLVAGGLFEVVADDLVALDERLTVLIEPVGESLV